METVSLWNGITPHKKSLAALTTHITTDVAIIGGGITGLTTALLLTQQGKKVVVLEANAIGEGTTGHSTGNLYVMVQPYYQRILSRFNETVVNQLIHARLQAISLIEELVNTYQLQCNFRRRSSYFLTNQDNQIHFLEKEIEILTRAGVTTKDVTHLPTTLPFKKTAEIPHQARINPLAYAMCLADELQKQNVSLYEDTPVLHIQEDANGNLIKTRDGSVLATHVIMATHIPKGISVIDMLAPPYRSYAIAARLTNEIKSSGHYWEINDPHYVLSTQPSSLTNNEDDLLVIAGSHHKTGQDRNALENFTKLETYLREHYQVADIVYRWSAQHYQSADGIPYVGASSHKKKIYVASGFYADGLVYGTFAAQLLADIILEKENALIEVVAPYRLTKPAALLTLSEVGFDSMLHFTKDRLASSEIKTLADIQKGDAKTIKLQGEKCGAYRDEKGELHIVSIVCTHMKCILNWNNAETTWDCPCHGSRFTFDGDVIEGPAYSNLKKISVDESEKTSS